MLQEGALEDDDPALGETSDAEEGGGEEEEEAVAIELDPSDPLYSFHKDDFTPCARSFSDGVYGLVVPLEEADVTDSFEGQIVDIRCRDHDLPRFDSRCGLFGYDFETEATEFFEPTASKAMVDLHLIDEQGHTAMVTAINYRPRVRFLRRDRSVSIDQAMREMCRMFPYIRGDRAAVSGSRMPILVGFDPAADDPTKRREHLVMTIKFRTFDDARRARYRPPKGFEVIDKKEDPVIEFLTVRKLDACGWVRIEQMNHVPKSQRTSTAQIEGTCVCANLKTIEHRGTSPFLVAAYDIEQYSSRGQGAFPNPKLAGDYVFAINTCFWRVGTPRDEIFNVIHVVGRAEGHYGAHTKVECYESEEELLRAWSTLIRCANPTMLSGYNIYGFDNMVMQQRANMQGVTSFWHISNYICDPAVAKPYQIKSAQSGAKEGMTFTIPGKVVHDMMVQLQLNFKLRSYSLNAVSAHFLKTKKFDLPIQEMFRQVERKEFDKLIKYVRLDAILVMKLLQDTNEIDSLFAMSKATSVFPSEILVRGQQIRVMNRIRQVTMRKGIAIVEPPMSKKRKFVGAKVIKPRTGFYTSPVDTLDFASLYPSILRAYNLCYSTWIPSRQALEKHLEVIPNLVYNIHRVEMEDGETIEHIFVMGVREADGSVRRCQSVLPDICEELGVLRKAAKKEMAKAATPELRALKDKEQLAYKVVM